MLASYQQALNRHRAKVYSYARYSLRATEDAEDVTQEVFIKLWQHWRDIDHERLVPWLMRVARNAVIDHVRRRKQERESRDQFEDVEAHVDSAALGPRERLDQQRFRAALLAAINRLDDPFRSIVVLRDIQGLSYADIEASLDMNLNQVKVYLHRARRKLRADPALGEAFDRAAVPAKRAAVSAPEAR